MTIKVIMERTVKPEGKEQLLALLTKLREKAIYQQGYVSGETLGSLENQDKHIVISIWQTLQDWRAWENNQDRRVLAAMIDNLLVSPTKAEVFVPASASISWHDLPEGI